MQKRLFLGIVVFIVLMGGAASAAQRTREGASSPVPIPPGEIALETVTAVPWLDVSNEDHVLEGAIFDADGNLLFCDVTGHAVLRASPDKTLSTVTDLPAPGAGGLAFHPDGRLFMAALDLGKGEGAILAYSPATRALETIVPFEAGYWPNDLVMTPEGGFYFSDFRGAATRPEGAVYYVTPDLSSPTAVIPNLAQANGVALSPDGTTLWATEFAANRLHRVDLSDRSTVSVIGSAVPWHFAGPAPDSMRTDSEGNVYVAIYGQGRVLVFNKNGIPIRQILLPGRDKGRNLRSTSLAIRPGAKDLYIVTSDETGARIFRSESVGKGVPQQNAR